jgi:uncharacterized protein involved in response to NO
MRAASPASLARLPVFLALGFRPFFLLAGIFAVFSVGVWAPSFARGLELSTYYGSIGWHSHEMVFGYSAAVVAGFLLTAVRNWTERPTVTGAPLGGLALLWMLGRLLPFFPDAVPGWAIALVELAFLPALAVAIALPLVRSGNKRNLIFLPLLLVYFLANLLVHLDIVGGTETLARRGTFLGVNVIVLLIVIMGGRVIPFFTERALPATGVRRRPWIEGLAPVTAVAFLFVELIAPDSLAAGLIAAAALVVNAIRLAGWYQHPLWRIPLLWVLHLGYGWVVVGYGLKAAGALALVGPQFTVHAFTVGGIGVLTLGMMARVALGHTGRPLQASAAVTVAFVLVNLAAFVRGVLPALFPQALLDLVALSGPLWATAFLIYTVAYARILTGPRVDGKWG